MKIRAVLLGITTIGIYFLTHSGLVAENTTTNEEPSASLIVKGDFSFEEDGLTGRLMEGPMVLTGLRSPNTMLTVGQPSRGLYAETLEIILSYDTPPLESGTYEIVSLQSYQDKASEQMIIVSVNYQEEDSHPRDSVTYDQAVSGNLTLIRDEDTASGEFKFSAQDTEENEIKVQGEFANIPIVVLD